MRALLLLAAALLLAAPARAADPTIEDGSARTKLNQARERWAAEGLEDYRFRQSIGCFCPPDVTKPRTMRVRNGRAVKPGSFHRRYATVPKLFAVIQEAIEDGAARLDVAYGASGLPRHIFVDSNAMIVDEELTLDASRLRRLK